MTTQSALGISALVILCVIAFMYIIRTVPGLPEIGKIKGEKTILLFLFFLAVLLMSIALVVDQSQKVDSVIVQRSASSCGGSKKYKKTNSKIYRKSAHSNSSSSKTVDIITMDGCGWCKKIQSELDEIKKHLHDYDVKVHKHTDMAAKKFNANAFPVAYVNGEKSKSVKGYQPAHKFAESVRAM